ncbi:GTP-binding protein [Synechococcus sp. PCC 7336]|uniref:CobW family GTP-binding protein n=1 Tax=Synechococcus sp. PCC 7336 TaxID=195250 RepID=UPI00034866AC|nr:GTP-binding protein [Synechococcus sp. PCC 7336]
MDVPQRGLPVTIVTGFLGSGKTTLLNHILSNQTGMRTAVLVNEFGEIGIDSELIVSTEEDMVELNNGCMCCTVRGDIAESVLRLMERSDANDKPIDYLVVETTGLADPLPVALTFLGSELRDLTRLDSIVTVVDASNFAPDLFESEVAHSQIAYGDVVVLNKTDLVDEDELKKLEKRIRVLKTEAHILKTVNSQVPLELLLDTDLFKSEAFVEEEHDHHGHDHHGHDHHGHDHHDHSHHLEEDGFNSVSFEADRPFNLDRFQKFLNNLPDGVFRAKGMLWFDESPDRHIFHLCGNRYTINSEDWPENSTPKNQMVLIGQHLKTKPLLKQLENCVQPSAAANKGFGKGLAS